jgi:preprotein translocase subunit SecD
MWKFILIVSSTLLVIIVALSIFVTPDTPDLPSINIMEVVTDDGKLNLSKLPDGVTYLMDVDLDFAIEGSLTPYRQELRDFLRTENARYLGINNAADKILIRFKSTESRDLASELLKKQFTDQFVIEEQDANKGVALQLSFTEAKYNDLKATVFKKNIAVLSKRAFELGIRHSIIKKVGASKIFVHFPKVRNLQQIKNIMTKSATFEFRFVNENADAYEAQSSGITPPGSKLYRMKTGEPVLLKRSPKLSGEYIETASAGFDYNDMPSISIQLDDEGAEVFSELTRVSVGKLLAVIYIEYKTELQKLEGGDAKKKLIVEEKVITIARIQEELGKRFEITGLESKKEAYNIALLLRAGTLAAPVYIVEEQVISAKTEE